MYASSISENVRGVLLLVSLYQKRPEQISKSNQDRLPKTSKQTKTANHENIRFTAYIQKSLIN